MMNNDCTNYKYKYKYNLYCMFCTAMSLSWRINFIILLFDYTGGADISGY